GLTSSPLGRRAGMRVIVLGASGNVGTAVVERLRRNPAIAHLTAVARHPPVDVAGADAGAAEGSVPVSWRAADIGRDDMDEVLAGADALIHLAWRFHPARDERQTWHDNVAGSIETFAAAARQGVGTIVYASSVGAYAPGPQTVGCDDAPVDERWPTHSLPTAAYGRQKSYLERVLDHVEDTGPMRIVRLRSAFVFQRSAAPEQRRIFGGPFVPGRVVASGVLPAIPFPRGLRIQVVAAADLAAAYEAALLRPVRGAFNIAADPVLDKTELARLLRARLVDVPVGLAHRGLGAAFRLRLAPTEPGLLDLAVSLPIMDTSRARAELGWVPVHDAREAFRSLLDGLGDPRGGATPRLAGDAGGPLRIHEIASGLGGRE
ncbi:MAG: NAD-dependent epimerase/dehydratase family protein, partial [Ilumatobacteraceae bacterium]